MNAAVLDASTNLCLGYWLGVVLANAEGRGKSGPKPPWRDRLSQLWPGFAPSALHAGGPDLDGQANSQGGLATALGEINQRAESHAQMLPAREESDPKTDRERRSSRVDIFTTFLRRAQAIETWLQSTQNALNHSGDCPDAEFLQAIAGQVQDTVSTWLTDIEQATEKLLPIIRKLPNGRNLARGCEEALFEVAAQSETTSSNLRMISWTNDGAQAKSRLEHELLLLVASFAKLRAKLQQVIDLR